VSEITNLLSKADLCIIEKLRDCSNDGLMKKIKHKQVQSCLEKLGVKDFNINDIYVCKSPKRVKWLFTMIINYHKLYNEMLNR
jgi:hypothetical protein